jgi:hypothetical protein
VNVGEKIIRTALYWFVCYLCGRLVAGFLVFIGMPWWLVLLTGFPLVVGIILSSWRACLGAEAEWTADTTLPERREQERAA